MREVRHWPALDGVRGLAVLMVVAGHAGWIPPAAGAMGVTVFFVLSGFLITRVLLDREPNLPRFYGTRAVRLLPALLLMLAGVLLLWLAQGRPLGAIGGQVLSTLLYVENFFTVQHWDTVLTHAWSLAVEEQFYLLWPFLLPFVMRRRRTALLLWSLIVLGIAIRAQVMREIHPIHAYASLPTNAYALLMGCLLAITGWRFRARLVCLALGLAGLAFSVVAAPFLPGHLIAAAPAAALAAMFLVHAGRQGAALLEWAPLRFAGRISYAWYLWHWPLLWLADATFEPVGSLPLVVLSLVLAVGSTFLLEEPLRRRWRTHLAERAASAQPRRCNAGSSSLE